MEINFNRLTPEELGKIKSVWSRVAQLDTITAATGSILEEIFGDVPDVFARGRFIIAKTEYGETICMVNPKYKTVGVNVEYTDLYGNRQTIAVRDLKKNVTFKQCMLALDGTNLKQLTGDIVKGAGKGAIDFAKGPGKKGAKKLGSAALKGTKTIFEKIRDACDDVVDNTRNNSGR